jgi:hypothetical protein
MAPYVCADPLATSHFSHSELLHDFDTRVANNHSSFAILLTRIAEIDERRLYLEEGYPSMKAFLVQRLRLFTDHSAEKRLTWRAPPASTPVSWWRSTTAGSM